MAVVAFDTLKLADRLQAGGFTPEQARTAASAFADALSGSDLATKADITEVRTELKADIAEVRAELKDVKAELKADIAQVRSDMREMELRLEARIDGTESKIEAVKAEFRRELAETKSDILLWMFGAMAAQTALIVGLVKLIH